MSRAAPMTWETRLGHYCKPTGRVWVTRRQWRRMVKKRNSRRQREAAP